jgi:AbiV family abortive infection protein
VTLENGTDEQGSAWPRLIEDLASGEQSVLEIFRSVPKNGDCEGFVTFTRVTHMLLNDLRIVTRLQTELAVEYEKRYSGKIESPDIFTRNFDLKDGKRRFQKLASFRKDMFGDGPSFIRGPTFSEALKQYQDLLAHVEHLWDDACRLYHEGHFPLSTFISILTIEEIGKLGRLWFDLLAWDRPISSVRNDMGQLGRDHRKKHFMAVVAGAIMNSRLDRILGLQNVKRLLQDVESGKLERLRQSCLYIDMADGCVVLPESVIREPNAKFFAILAGELWAETLGNFPWDFNRMNDKVTAFEIGLGFNEADLNGT